MATVSEILKQAKSLDLLREIEALLCDYLELDTAGLFLAHDQVLQKNVEVLLQMNIDSLKGGYPLAYIRGKQDFYGLEFKVNKNVLIPRRDTEILVSEVINCIQKLYSDGGGVKMVELGVGSGCISISVAHEFRGKMSILGVEKSREALEVAQGNVRMHDLQDIIELREGDLLEGAEGDFDILVANLPYVDEDSELGEGVREYEPHMALFADEGGLALYRKVLEQVQGSDLTPRVILFEIGYDQGDRMRVMCGKYMPEYEVSIIKDLENRDRVVKMVKK